MSRKPSGWEEEIKIFYDHGLHIPSRTIVVESILVDPEHGESGVDAHMWSRLEKGLKILEKLPPKVDQEDTITILLNNPGGEIYHMFAMYDRIRSSPCRIVIEATGHVMSAASIIFQAGDVRRLHRHATMMIHTPHWTVGGHTKDIMVGAKELERLQKDMCSIYLERIRQKRPKFSEQQLLNKMKADCYISAAEVVELGLADEIIPHTELP